MQVAGGGELIGAEIAFVGDRAGRNVVFERTVLAGGQRKRQRLNNPFDQIILKLEDIPQGRLRCIGPKQLAIGRLDELRGYPQVLAIRKDGAGQNGVHLGLFGNHLHVDFRGGGKARGRHGGPHDQRINRSERVGDGIRQADRQEVGRLVLSQDAKWKDDQPGESAGGWLLGRSRACKSFENRFRGWITLLAILPEKLIHDVGQSDLLGRRLIVKNRVQRIDR